MKFDYNEFGDIEDVFFVLRNIGKDFLSRVELNRERGYNGFFMEREILLLNGKKLFIYEGNNLRSLYEKLLLKYVDISLFILG